METNRLVGLGVLVVALVAGWMLFMRSTPESQPPAPTVRPVPTVVENLEPDRAEVPSVAGASLSPTSGPASPPTPIQWAGGAGGIPSNTWWSSALVGPGAVGLWPLPLALNIEEDGRVAFGNPPATVADDGSRRTPFIPSLFLESDTRRATSVVDYGAFHSVIELTDDAGSWWQMTLMQGSPALELQVEGPLTLLAPGVSIEPTADPQVRRLRLESGDWLLATPGETAYTTEGDRLLFDFDAPTAMVLAPDLGGQAWLSWLALTVEKPVLETTEFLSVDDGVVSQQLVIDRRGHPSAIALLPHQRRLLNGALVVGDLTELGTVASARGPLTVVESSSLDLAFPSVPIVWTPVGPEPDRTAVEADLESFPRGGVGSYFGGKEVHSFAQLGAVARLGGFDNEATAAMELAIDGLDRLANPTSEPRLTWDPGWGSIILEPAEFGSGSDLNDHSLQYGYWVAAASMAIEYDRSSIDRYQPVIDALIADYGGRFGADVGPAALPDVRTWNAFEGHSWASGTSRFADGNNLESVSESAFAWWAAARWFVVTGRSDLAEPFIARFTIESHLTNGEWLPNPSEADGEETRPWTGVVWAAKTDMNTWFDPAPASALGIRLLPAGPNALARYSGAAEVAAATERWAWCAERPGVCTTRWGNLLDTDAVVAGLPAVTSADPEPSTGQAVTAWWRQLWETLPEPSIERCSAGAAIRSGPDGTRYLLASNPSLGELQVRCWGPDGSPVVDRPLGPGETLFEALP